MMGRKKKYIGIYLVLIVVVLGCNNGSTIGPPIPPGESLEDVEVYFDVQWLASESFSDVNGTIPIANGMPARYIADGIGNYDIPYTGVEAPSVRYTTPPLFSNGLNGEKGYIFIPNAAGQTYGDGKRPIHPEGGDINQPLTVYAVVRRLQAINNEGYWARGISFRNRSNDHYEIGNAPSAAMSFPDGSGILEANKISIVKVVYNGANSKIWINKVPYAGGNEVNVGSDPMQIIGYGTPSHVAHHDFFGFWIKFGLLSQPEDDFVFDLLAEYFDPGVYPPYPIADNLKIDFDRDAKAFIINYDYINPDTTIVESGTEYQWYIRKGGFNGSLESVYPLAGENAKRKTLVRSDYPNDLNPPYPTFSHVYCGVKTAGSSRELHSPYFVDNIE